MNPGPDLQAGHIQEVLMKKIDKQEALRRIEQYRAKFKAEDMRSFLIPAGHIDELRAAKPGAGIRVYMGMDDGKGSVVLVAETPTDPGILSDGAVMLADCPPCPPICIPPGGPQG